ncbi:DUF4153 domain-containing protein [Deinococcus sp.]|uniref:DUF4153 domain-containing protein n=1 Tax=Deinococcus sp. TaxID=47478 RepID=UPI003C7E63C3
MNEFTPDRWQAVPEAAPETPVSETVKPGARKPADGLPLLLTLGLALLAYLLTRGTLLTRNTGSLGLNMPLLTGTLACSVLLALRLRQVPVQPAALALLALGLACAVGLALRDGALMSGLNLLGLFAAVGIGAGYLRFPGLTRLSVGGVLLAALWAWIRGVYGMLASALRFPWARLNALRRSGRRFQTAQTRRVLTGLLLTLPPLLVFGWLLSGADPHFGALISRLFDWKLPDWNLHDLTFALVQLTLWALLLGGPVYAALLAGRAAPQLQAEYAPTLGLTELGIPLISVSALFCAYLLVQAEPLFRHTLAAGILYSDYVRRGFGELTAVAALTLVVLLLAHTLLRRDLRTTLAYRLISAAVLLPLALLIASAYHRLELYVSAYGLSEVRVLGGVFLAWVVLSLLAYTVLLWRNGLERFAYFSLVSGLALIVGLNGLNPGRLIANVNLSRTLDTQTETGGWLAGGVGRTGIRSVRPPIQTLLEIARLGPDALPTLLDWINRNGETDLLREQKPTHDSLACVLDRRNWSDIHADWRVWNLARSRARQLTGQLEALNPGLLREDCLGFSEDENDFWW